jgi:hypothetical protein
MTASDSELLFAIKEALRHGYWSRFNVNAREEMARVALEAILCKEAELLSYGVRESGAGTGMGRR